jgi:hypothetical protein
VSYSSSWMVKVVRVVSPLQLSVNPFSLLSFPLGSQSRSSIQCWIHLVIAFEFPSGSYGLMPPAANRRHHLTVNVTVAVWLTPPADPVTVNV